MDPHQRILLEKAQDTLCSADRQCHDLGVFVGVMTDSEWGIIQNGYLICSTALNVNSALTCS